MIGTPGRRFLILSISSLIAVCWSSANAQAAILIPTNQNGADAEVREDADNHMRPNTDPLWGPVGAPRGRNRGGVIGQSVGDAGGMELATRIKDATANPANDRTSAMYLKFDISGLTQSDLDNNHQALLRLAVRNANNLSWSRIYEQNPYYGSLPADNTNPEFVAFRSDIANWTRIKFNVYGLKPEPMDVADPRRFGDPDPTLPVPNYNWIEGPSAGGDPFPEGGATVDPLSLDQTTWDPVKSPTIGPIGPITWYNAPGITPDSRLTPAQDAGKFNFNSDLELLGTFSMPDPPGAGPTSPDGAARLPVGLPIEFTDPGGTLHDLIQRAKDNGRTHLTLVVAHALNGLQNATGETLQVTPNNLINFNYLVNPKEIDSDAAMAGLQLNNDTGWDPDASGPLTPTGSPYSCFNHANCGPNPVGLGDNTTGRFSPTLVLRVPEPASAMLAGLGLLAAMTVVRRRK
jgi:hypothetical protein